MRILHLVVPDTVGDPRHPSGGNVYDEELAAGLQAIGQVVRLHRVSTAWVPASGGRDASAELARVLATLPDDSTVLVDGLIGLAAADVLEHESRLRLWLLVHLPWGLAGGDRHRERRALSAATGVVTTSPWTRCWLLETYGPLAPRQVVVAAPGVSPAELGRGNDAGTGLLCVGALVPDKGQDVLLRALGSLTQLDWSCRLVGPVDRDRRFVREVREQARRLGDRVTLTGPLDRRFLYSTADLLVLPTRLETYGMVVTEALARGIPVVASDTGGVAEAMGRAGDGGPPGLLVPPGDADALAAALRSWWEDAALRDRLRAAARARRRELADWSSTALAVQEALDLRDVALVDGGRR